MFYQGRDAGIKRISAIPSRRCHGMGLGVVMFDDDTPGFPGDVRNPSGFPYPIQYQIAEGVNHMTLVVGQDIEGCRRATIEAAQRLEYYGCRAIVGECGYFALFQQDVAEAVDIPVFLSSLLQVPLAQKSISAKKSVGIAAAVKSCLSEAHLINAGIDPASNFKVFGVEDEYHCPEFQSLWDMEKRPPIPTADYEQAEKDFVFACKDFVEKNPEIGSLVLECSGFPSFGRAIQRAVQMPVYDWSTMMDYAYLVSAHRDFYGHV